VTATVMRLAADPLAASSLRQPVPGVHPELTLSRGNEILPGACSGVRAYGFPGRPAEAPFEASIAGAVSVAAFPSPAQKRTFTS
jgi:hypothetical protein